MILVEFIAKWQKSQLTEKSAAQSHFIDLCRVLEKSEPTSDATGHDYSFEKGTIKTGGGSGFADVWKRGLFAWEYKGKKKNLAEAYQQLLKYREDLENPPLLVVCDLNRFEVHTNFTGTVKSVFAFDLVDLGAGIPTATCAMPPLDVLRALFEDPNRLRPNQTTVALTQDAANNFGQLARNLIEAGFDPHPVSRFLIRVLFCLFAEDAGLLPPKLFTSIIEKTKIRPAEFGQRLGLLFAAMASGGSFGADDIKHFNGGLFNDAQTLPLTRNDLSILVECAELDWSSIEPSIFGTLFERSLDPQKRSQLGAHYTSRDDILLIVEPVLMAPLRRQWELVQQQAQAIVNRREKVKTLASKRKASQDLSALLKRFQDVLVAVRVLDPACGSGNFLYVALRALLDLEKDVIIFAISNDAGGFFPAVGPEQMHGLEVNEYAHELAPITVWIGYIQWLRDAGFGQPSEPILRPLDTILEYDAVLSYDASGKVLEPEWPSADIVIGNPPFLGDKKMLSELGSSYVADLRKLYKGRIPGGADLVTYWFERTRQLIQDGKIKRAGLLSTNSIRTGANRAVLDHIQQSGSIFMAWDDRPWVLDGAAVRVSIVGFDDGAELTRTLNGQTVPSINADLSSRPDVTKAIVLPENDNLMFLGMMKSGPFDIDARTAQIMLSAPVNVNGRPNSDVVKPRLAGKDITGRIRRRWIIDFNNCSEQDALQYELPFEYVRMHVKPLRNENSDIHMRKNWWLHGRSRPALRAALAGKARCIVTPEVAKYRLFVWMDTTWIPDHKLHVCARDDDYFFGVLHSRVHEVWSLAHCSWMGAGNDPSYSSSRTFGTFPFPWAPGLEPTPDTRIDAIANCARSLDFKRNAWLNPPGATPTDLKKRTLTDLYNSRPAWLIALHATLDASVLAAYGWPINLSDEELLQRLLSLNHARAHTPDLPQP
ncbi:DNA methyltransferase yeeA [Capsulimonas corticalis]|uniref:site-specific DNA-methyltransferase (adenine-specific) n=1 Tax=Capsulimonas corticalis TaxID=2219043 RepID=A0A402D4Z5_9BACT|nr:DNA methyltransferase [Capsulimonas corticalis]BDI32582.1 DNA methyltransferase yeeA [Capsulimonas corticalis]